MDYKHIVYDKEGEMAIITFNRPEVRNALNYLAIDETLEAARKAEADEAVRVLIFTGAGDKAFISGADIGELQQRNTLTLGEKAGAGQFTRDYGKTHCSRDQRFCCRHWIGNCHGLYLKGGCGYSKVRAAGDKCRYNAWKWRDPATTQAGG